MATDRSDWPKKVEMAGQILVTQTANEERLSAPALGGSKRVAFSAVGDNCELCASLDGKVFLADSDLARRYNPPLHPNCNCLWVEVGDDEPWDEADQDYMSAEYEKELAGRELLGKATWIDAAPGEGKYEMLRVPAAPRGRDFTFRRELDPKTGEMRSRLTWHRERYELPGLDAQTIVDGVADVGERWRPLGGGGGGVPPVGPTGGPPAGPSAGWRSSVSGTPNGPLRRLAPPGRKRLDESPVFAAAESVGEVEALLRDRIAQHTELDLTGAHLSHARTIGAQLAAHAEEWPEAAKMLDRISTYYDNESADYAVTDQDGKWIEFNSFWWDEERPLSRLTAEAETNGAVPPGTGSVAGILCEEWGHQVKNWIDGTPYGTELDRWLDENPLPEDLCELGVLEIEPIERRRQETFGRGFRAIEMTPESGHSWLLRLRAELDRIVTLIRLSS